MIKDSSIKSVTTRFSLKDYLEIQREAEKRGSNLAEVIRNSWETYQTNEQIKQQLANIELRQRKVMFEMICAVVGISSKERDEVVEQLKLKGVTW
ncbi:hypothetical protein SAMN02745753_02732 [Marinomonas polaris DSM 16579]|uniref:Ribbon-helix-helix protein, copG family n=1 Tax=Marinomonas polaris DSM 16579 TaxID=1122206 RepID=A0A1M5EYX2_9GAMM|nr:hypothetical protein [Marinomonas polaris]SHF84356.1 hypothetical protein SAMN02745753_02732 [Marinomonas polaris DSM 16579]